MGRISGYDDETMKFRIVLLTNGHEHGWRIVQGLKEHNIIPEYIVFSRKGLIWWDYTFRNKRIRPIFQYAMTPFRLLSCMLRSLDPQRCVSRSSTNVIYSGGLNSMRLRRDLEAISPDFIILGGIGILSAQIIKTARYGVINVHPGLLPWARNVGVVGRSLERGIPVGITVHYVDEGVDTGRIIERHLLPITSNDQSLDELENKAQRLCANAMIKIVADVLMKGHIPKGHYQAEKYPPCTWMNRAEREALNIKIKDGLARDLYQKWQRYCDGSSETLLSCPLKEDKE